MTKTNNTNKTITNTPNNPDGSKTKPIKPIGRGRTSEKNTSIAKAKAKNWNNINSMEDEAVVDSYIPEEQIKEIVQLAKNNPVTNEMIEKAKEFTAVNREKIHKQCTDIVALYNIAYEKPFFFITPAEARMAIDYVKKCRNGYTNDMENQEEKDIFIHNIINNVLTIVPAPKVMKSIPNLLDSNIHEEMQRDLDEICGIHMGNEETIEATINYHKQRKRKTKMKTHNPLNAFKQTLTQYEPFNKDDIPIPTNSNDSETKHYVYYAKAEKDGWECNPLSLLSLSFINQVFSVIEHQNLMVDFMLMNSYRIADIRNFGQTVYDEYPQKERLDRKIFGKIFTAEIYPCNQLLNNQVIFGSLINPNKPEKAILLNVTIDGNLF